MESGSSRVPRQARRSPEVVVSAQSKGSPLIANATFTVDLAAPEAEVLQLVCQGMTDKEICSALKLRNIELTMMLANLHVAFDLTKATRERQLTWEFVPEVATNAVAANG
jgi:hypothetical protein